MRLFALLLLLPLAVQAVTVSVSSQSYSGTLAEDGTISHIYDVGYVSPEPVSSMTLSYYIPKRAYNVNWHGDRGTITDDGITPYSDDFSLLRLRADFDGAVSEYALRLSYDTPPDIKAYGRLVQATACPFAANITSRITLPAGSEFLSSEPHADFEGSPPSVGLFLPGCIKLTYIRETDGGYTLSRIGENYLLLHNSQENFSGEIANATAFIPRIESELGLPFPFAHVAYVILPNQSTEIRSWASGEYHSPGVVLLRPNATTSYGVEEAAVHETTHAFNSQIPQVKGGDNWFDEGTAKYMEHLAFLETGTDYEGHLFSNRSSDKVRISDLIYYYRNNYSLMEQWDPTNASFDEWQDFGYAYSQLVIRTYVDDHGPGALRVAYACLAAHGGDALPRQEFNDVVLGCMSNASGGADPEEIMNPGRGMMGNETDFTAYIGRLGSPYFPNPEPTPAPSGCSTHLISCANCTAYSGCGWSKSRGTCLAGSSNGSTDGNSSGSDWAWVQSNCAGASPTPTPAPANCGTHSFSCGGCTQYSGCGWSDAQGRCLSGTSAGSSDGSSSGADWVWVEGDCTTTPPSPNCCSGFVLLPLGGAAALMLAIRRKGLAA